MLIIYLINTQLTWLGHLIFCLLPFPIDLLLTHRASERKRERWRGRERHIIFSATSQQTEYEILFSTRSWPGKWIKLASSHEFSYFPLASWNILNIFRLLISPKCRAVSKWKMHYRCMYVQYPVAASHFSLALAMPIITTVFGCPWPAGIIYAKFVVSLRVA